MHRKNRYLFAGNAYVGNAYGAGTFVEENLWDSKSLDLAECI